MTKSKRFQRLCRIFVKKENIQAVSGQMINDTWLGLMPKLTSANQSPPINTLFPVMLILQ